jgi:hypothetical protein
MVNAILIGEHIIKLVELSFFHSGSGPANGKTLPLPMKMTFDV